MGSLRDAILAAEDLPREQVQTDEWAPFGVPFVFVRGLTSAERDAYELSLTVAGPNGGRMQRPNLKNIRTAFVVKIVVDESGERIFTDKDVEELGKKNARVIDHLWEVGRRMSGMTDEEVNPSKGDQEDSNSSDSPSPSE